MIRRLDDLKSLAEDDRQCVDHRAARVGLSSPLHPWKGRSVVTVSRRRQRDPIQSQLIPPSLLRGP
jgi:hypothetical protein